MADRLYLMLVGLERPFDACNAALSGIARCFASWEQPELWSLGTYQAAFLAALRGTPLGLMRGRFAAALKHADIGSVMFLEAGEWIVFDASGKSLSARINARLREAAGGDLSLNRRPTVRSSRRVHVPTSGPPEAKG